MDDSTVTENSDEMEYEEEDDDDNDYYYNYDTYADSGGDGHTEASETGSCGNDFETLQGKLGLIRICLCRNHSCPF